MRSDYLEKNSGRSDVKKKLGISLNWEIKIFGER